MKKRDTRFFVTISVLFLLQCVCAEFASSTLIKWDQFDFNSENNLMRDPLVVYEPPVLGSLKGSCVCPQMHNKMQMHLRTSACVRAALGTRVWVFPLQYTVQGLKYLGLGTLLAVYRA